VQKLGKNKFLVDTLAEFLPRSRARVTPGMLKQLAKVTGFSNVEIFRKCAPCLSSIWKKKNSHKKKIRAAVEWVSHSSPAQSSPKCTLTVVSGDVVDSCQQNLCRFLWYALKDRTFDEAVVGDLVHLKEGLDLSTTDVAAALLERSKRIEKKFGNLVLPAQGAKFTHSMKIFHP
jgi:hypothetical protein